MKIIISFALIIASHFAFANNLQPQSPDANVLAKIAQANEQQAALDSFSIINGLIRSNDVVTPFYEYDKTAYLLMSDGLYYDYAKRMKQIIAENLPDNTTLVIYTRSGNVGYQESLFETYSKYIDPSRLKILEVPYTGSSDFWTRDNLPIPVWKNGKFTLVDAQYYYNFEPDQYISQLLGAQLSQHNYFFEGGNFVVNGRGECIVVNRRRSYPGGTSDTGAIPDAIFETKYGCTKLIRFEHLKGIGHSDEVVKFMTDDIIVTDTEDYVAELQQAGYEVVMLPEPRGEYETYANALQVNDVLFVPVFGQDTDQEAIDTYKELNLGLTIVPMPSRRLANYGQGGIHCITMNYPEIPLEDLADSLNGNIISID